MFQVLKWVSAVLLVGAVLGLVATQALGSAHDPTLRRVSAGPPSLRAQRSHSESFAEFSEDSRILESGNGHSKTSSGSSSSSSSSTSSSESVSVESGSAETGQGKGAGCADADTLILLDSTGSLRGLFEAERAYAQRIVDAHAQKAVGRLALLVYSSKHKLRLYGFNHTQDLRQVVESEFEGRFWSTD